MEQEIHHIIDSKAMMTAKGLHCSSAWQQSRVKTTL